MMELDKTQLQWLLAGIGAVVVALIYLWGIRTRLKEEIRKRRRRSSLANEPKLGETPPDLADEVGEVHEFGELGRVTPDHHLADKILVDVEIRPLNRGVDPERAPSFGKSPLEMDKSLSGRKTADASPAEPAAGAAPPPLDPVGEMRFLEPEAPATPKTTIALTVMAPRHRLFKGTDIQIAAEEAGFQLGTTGLFERYPTEETAADTPIFSLAHLRRPGSFESPALAELTTPGLLLFMSLPGPLEGMKALDLLVLAVDQLARKLGGVICDEHRHKMTNQGLLNLRDKIAKLGQSPR